MGLDEKAIMDRFYPVETVYFADDGLTKDINSEIIGYQKATKEIKNQKSGDVIARKGRRFVRSLLEKLKKENITNIPVEDYDILGKFAAEEIVDSETGEFILEFNETITEDTLEKLKEAGIKKFNVYYIDNISYVASLRNTIIADKVDTKEEAITEIYKKFRPTDPPTLNVAETFLKTCFSILILTGSPGLDVSR